MRATGHAPPSRLPGRTTPSPASLHTPSTFPSFSRDPSSPSTTLSLRCESRVSHSLSPQHQLKHPLPSVTNLKAVVIYGVRLFGAWFLMECMLHLFHVVAISKVAVWEDFSPMELVSVSYWNFKLIWLKVCGFASSTNALSYSSFGAFFVCGL